MSAEPVAVVELPHRVPYGFHAFFVTEVLKPKPIIIYIFFTRDATLTTRGSCLGRNNSRNKLLHKTSCVHNYIICYMLLWRRWRTEKLDDSDIRITYTTCIFIWMPRFCLHKNLHFHFNSKLGFFYLPWPFELREIGGFLLCSLRALGSSSFSSTPTSNLVVSLFSYYQKNRTKRENNIWRLDSRVEGGRTELEP